MAITSHVTVNLASGSVGVSRPGFGVPLIVSHTAAWAERVRYYNNSAQVLVDFAIDTPEYLAAAAAFSQDPTLARLAIGRAANAPTHITTINVNTLRNSYDYQLRVSGPGMADTTLTFGSDASATANEVATGLQGALNGVTGKNFTATLNVDEVVVTGDAASNWFSVAAVNVDDLTTEVTTADPGIAADLAAISAEDNDWYALYTLYNSTAYGLAVAAWVESNAKLYICETSDGTTATLVEASGTDLAKQIKDLSYANTACIWHNRPAAFIGSAWLGDTLPLDPGSTTWKFRRLAGVEVYKLTATQRNNITNRNCNGFERSGSQNHTFNGTRADGSFIDITRGDAWLNSEIRADVFSVFLSNDKVAYTDEDVVLLVAAVKGVMRRAIDAKVAAATPAPVVVGDPVADEAPGDVAARIYRGLRFSFTRAGAIHEGVITGTASL